MEWSKLERKLKCSRCKWVDNRIDEPPCDTCIYYADSNRTDNFEEKK